MSSLRVLIVNDSPTMCLALRASLALAQDVEVVGQVHNGALAVDAVQALRPDVVLMDVVMPGCDGYEATRAIMSKVPTPVVMITAAANPRDERVIFEALGAGALSVVHAPPSPANPTYRLASAALAQLLRSMAKANLRTRAAPAPNRLPVPEAALGSQIRAIGIVASAGGPPALVTVFKKLAARTLPPILLVQHMTPGFLPGFAAWLSEASGYSVVVARHGERLAPGCVYMAPDDRHLGASSDGSALVTTDPPSGPFRPSGDYLLASLGRAFGSGAAGVVLSGMGRDGAAGAVELADAGGVVVAESAESAAVDGMPRAVRERVPSAQVVTLEAIAGFLLSLTSAP